MSTVPSSSTSTTQFYILVLYSFLYGHCCHSSLSTPLLWLYLLGATPLIIDAAAAAGETETRLSKVFRFVLFCSRAMWTYSSFLLLITSSNIRLSYRTYFAGLPIVSTTPDSMSVNYAVLTDNVLVSVVTDFIARISPSCVGEPLYMPVLKWCATKPSQEVAGAGTGAEVRRVTTKERVRLREGEGSKSLASSRLWALYSYDITELLLIKSLHVIYRNHSEHCNTKIVFILSCAIETWETPQMLRTPVMTNEKRGEEIG